VRYVPAGHREQAEAPSEDEYLPAVHCTQEFNEVAPRSFENVPDPHARHELAEVAAGIVEYLPSPHFTQSNSATFPSDGRNFPAPQSLQVEAPSSALNVPATRM